jgi:hypothetical protein
MYPGDASDSINDKSALIPPFELSSKMTSNLQAFIQVWNLRVFFQSASHS